MAICDINLIFNVKKKIGGGVTYNGQGSSYLSMDLMTFMLWDCVRGLRSKQE